MQIVQQMLHKHQCRFICVIVCHKMETTELKLNKL